MLALASEEYVSVDDCGADLTSCVPVNELEMLELVLVELLLVVSILYKLELKIVLIIVLVPVLVLLISSNIIDILIFGVLDDIDVPDVVMLVDEIVVELVVELVVDVSCVVLEGKSKSLCTVLKISGVINEAVLAS